MATPSASHNRLSQCSGKRLPVPELRQGTIVTGVTGQTTQTNTLSLSASATVPSNSYLFSSYPACPGPSTTLGGLYAAPAPSTTVTPYAPVPQHPNSTAAGAINSQIWPPPSTKSEANLLSGNYIDQRDVQFTNRQFVDYNGKPLLFNVIVFHVYPYTYSNPGITCSGGTGAVGTTACPYNATTTFPYGLLFEGAKGCFSDTNAADCTFTPGFDEWANPNVTVTQDCGQRP